MKHKKTSLWIIIAAVIICAAAAVCFLTKPNGSQNPGSDDYSFRGTTFCCAGQSYDLAGQNSMITAITSAVPVGRKIVIECHVNPKNKLYRIFNRETRSFDRDIAGTNLTWYGDDINTAVYSFWENIYTYDGYTLKAYQLQADEYISGIAYSADGTKLNITIASDSGNGRSDEIEPATADYAKAGITERMSTAAAKDIDSIYSVFSGVDAAELAAALNAAAGSRIAPPEDLPSFYYELTAYLSGDSGEQLSIYAGLDENIVLVRYTIDSGAGEEGYFSDAALYWLVRGSYRIDEAIDEAAYEKYRDAIEARAQSSVDTAKNMAGAAAFTGYEITRFTLVDLFETEAADYAVYSWNVAFTTDDPELIGWVGGMHLDADGRVGTYEQSTYFVVRTSASGEEEYRFMFWDLYYGPDEENARENAKATLEGAF